MLKVKRLNNLKLLKEKSMNRITKEINTLNNEVKKSYELAYKLKNIKNNSKNENKYNNSMNIMHKYEFDRKIIEQIYICENRVLFLKKELIRAKNKLGSIITQKKVIENKIKLKSIQQIQEKEDKIIRDTPYFKKS